MKKGEWGGRGYRSYLDADGARRQEVKKTEETAQGNEEVVAEAVRKGKEIQDYIDDWEPDDEDDELDEEALWASVLTITAGFQKDGRFRVPAVRDKKKMNVLEAVSRLSGTDLLSLCVPAGTVISENWISTAAFPSALSFVGRFLYALADSTVRMLVSGKLIFRRCREYRTFQLISSLCINQ